jgi:hypothetical protein
MRATAALSIAALASALLATPALALGFTFDNSDEHDDLGARIRANGRLDSNGNDALSVIAIDSSADGSAEVCEG